VVAALPAPEIPPEFAQRLALKRGEVAGLLGCSERFVDSLIKDGRLRVKVIRRTPFVVASDVWGLFGICGECREISQEAETFLRGVG
jgi:hypothetical protein